MAYRVVTVKDGQVTEVTGNVERRAKKSSTLNVGVFGQGGGWPIVSDAAGIDPSQIPDAMALDRSHGMNVEYTSNGNPVLTDPAMRKKYLSVHGLYDRNGGYGDPAPGDSAKYDRGPDSGRTDSAD